MRECECACQIPSSLPTRAIFGKNVEHGAWCMHPPRDLHRHGGKVRCLMGVTRSAQQSHHFGNRGSDYLGTHDDSCAIKLPLPPWNRRRDASSVTAHQSSAATHLLAEAHYHSNRQDGISERPRGEKKCWPHLRVRCLS
jgi:hypothetical protein